MATATAPSREILEDRWDRFVSRPNGTFSPKVLRLCRALNEAVAQVAFLEHEDEAPLETELLELVHERIVQRVSEGGHFTRADLGLPYGPLPSEATGKVAAA